MYSDSRVKRRRARYTLAREDVSLRSSPHSYPTYFRCKMDPEMKRKLSPWTIEKSFIQETGVLSKRNQLH